MQNHYDCIVIGGGPAGGTAAALVAEAGFSTLLVEREAVPRFHVGESLMPETYWTLQRLGVLAQMQTSPFVKKYSVQFVSQFGPGIAAVLLPRARPARVLADVAGGAGPVRQAAVRQRRRERSRLLRPDPRAERSLFDGPRATGVRLQTLAGEPRSDVRPASSWTPPASRP